MELNLIPAQTGNGSMKRYASCKINCQLIADLRRGRTWNSKLIRSFMSFLYGGQLSTNKLVLQFVQIFIVSFPVWAGIKINSSPGNGTMKTYTSCKISLSVDIWPPKRKDMQLLNEQEFYVTPLWRSAINWQTDNMCTFQKFHFLVGLESKSI